MSTTPETAPPTDTRVMAGAALVPPPRRLADGSTRSHHRSSTSTPRRAAPAVAARTVDQAEWDANSASTPRASSGHLGAQDGVIRVSLSGPGRSAGKHRPGHRANRLDDRWTSVSRSAPPGPGRGRPAASARNRPQAEPAGSTAELRQPPLGGRLGRAPRARRRRPSRRSTPALRSAFRSTRATIRSPSRNGST